MAYNISLSNGEPLVTIADGTVDVNYTSLNLVGKNFAGYGALMNENFVYLLENFANTAEPANPITGQLWYDLGTKVMKVRTPNNTWKVISSATASPNPPPNPVIGDQWWDTTSEQLKIWSGNPTAGWKLIGPLWTVYEGVTGAIPDTIRDTTGTDRVVIKFYVNDSVIAIWSKEQSTYTVEAASTIPGFHLTGQPQQVKPGLTFADLGIHNADGYTNLQRNILWGTAENALNLNGVRATAFVRRDRTGNVQTIADTIEFDNASAMLLGGNVGIMDNNRYTIGSDNYRVKTVYATTFNGVATSAQYADLAERFFADAVYEPGTVVRLGGEREITQENAESSEEVFGVISTDPAYLMNQAAGNDPLSPPVALSGRVPVKVTGMVQRGDRLISAGNGHARAATKEELTPWNVIGRALEDKPDLGLGVVEAIVRLVV